MLSQGPQPDSPTLFELGADGQSLDFFFKRCTVCGEMTFPMTSPGCQGCGAALDEAPIEKHKGEGVLLEHVTIYLPLAPDMPTPLTIGHVRIAPGIVKEAVISVGEDSDLQLGMTMCAVARMHDDQSHFACVFVPVPENAA